MSQISYTYIGLDCTEHSNHYEDFSSTSYKINTIAITWDGIVLVFTTLHPSNNKEISTLKSKYDNLIYFNFCQSESELLSNFINSFGKAIHSVCYWSSKKQANHIKARLESNGLSYPDNILTLNYDTTLSYFEVIAGLKYSGFNIHQVSKFLSLSQLPRNTHNSSQEFNSDFVGYMSYVYEYCRLFEAIDNKLDLINSLYRISEMANVPVDIVQSNIKVGHYMIADEYNKRGIRYVKNRKQKGESYKGGFNIPPTHKTVRNALVFDFKAAYINIQMAFKISPENICLDDTVDNVIGCVNGSRFYRKENTVAEDIQNRFYKYR